MKGEEKEISKAAGGRMGIFSYLIIDDLSPSRRTEVAGLINRRNEMKPRLNQDIITRSLFQSHLVHVLTQASLFMRARILKLHMHIA